MKGTPTPGYLDALETLADLARRAASAADLVTRGLRADRFATVWLGLAPEGHREATTARAAVEQLERAAAAVLAAHEAAQALSSRDRREEAALFDLLRACSTPHARSLVHRVEAALALHPELPAGAGVPTESYLLTVRSVATRCAHANDLAGLAQLAAALEADAARSQAPGPSTPPGTARGGLPS